MGKFITTMRPFLRYSFAVAVLQFLACAPAHAWGPDGHKIISKLAVEYLPPDTPAFLRDTRALSTMEYMGPEPDRWRSRAEPELATEQAPDHFLDEEWADLAGTPCAQSAPGCGPIGTLLPKGRYDYIRALAAAQARHPELNLSPDKVGMQPWQVEECWERLKSDLRDYRQLAAAHGDVGPVETVILFETGWLSHYVADGSMPLHTSINYNGWIEKANPHGYTTERGIHSQFESAFVGANVRPSDVAPLVASAKSQVIADEWTQYLEYLHRSHTLVEQTYSLYKLGGFTDAGTPAGKEFAVERLAAGAVELRNLIYTAWVRSADPVPEFDHAK